MKRKKYPFTAIVGQEDMKLALVLNAVLPVIGGVLIKGEKGTAKSTAVRALADILPPFGSDGSEAMQVVELPVNATEDRVVGTIDLEHALKEGEKKFEPGLLAKAHNNILYVDEINLLDDHLVDVLLDAAAMGVNTVEREGVSWSHPSRFVLVGTMNPEEGELRPQLLDRFGLCVEVRGMAEPEARLQVMTRRAAFEDDPVGFRAAWQERENEIAERIVAARRKLGSVAVPEDVMRAIVELAIETEVDGHRADIVMLKTVKAIAAWRGDGEAAREDVMQAARLVLPHRMRRKPFQNVGSAKAVR